jgi:hypothetical protein
MKNLLIILCLAIAAPMLASADTNDAPVFTIRNVTEAEATETYKEAHYYLRDIFEQYDANSPTYDTNNPCFFDVLSDTNCLYTALNGNPGMQCWGELMRYTNEPPVVYWFVDLPESTNGIPLKSIVLDAATKGTFRSEMAQKDCVLQPITDEIRTNSTAIYTFGK